MDNSTNWKIVSASQVIKYVENVNRTYIYLLSEFDVLSYTAINTSVVDPIFYTIPQVNVTIVLRRHSSYYTVMFVIPCSLMMMMALFGELEDTN
jgi:hypothetical protein